MREQRDRQRRSESLQRALDRDAPSALPEHRARLAELARARNEAIHTYDATTADLERLVAAAHRDGLSITEIADTLGVSRPTVYALLKRAGEEPEARRPPAHVRGGPRTSTPRATALNDTPTAFVLMPFDEDFRSIYDRIIEPAILEAGFTPVRADTALDQQNVMADVIRGLAAAALVVADLSGPNPNVMYELGIAHALNKPTVLISQNLEDVPFDLRAYRVQTYTTHFEEAAELRRHLAKVAAEHREGSIDFSNPVADFAPDRLPATESSAEGGAEAGQPPAPEPEEAGFIDHLAEAEEKGAAFVRTLGTIGMETGAVGDRMSEHTARLEALSEGEPGAAGAVQWKRIGIQAAHDLDAYADRLEEVLPELEEQAETLSEASLGYATWLKDTDDHEQRREFRESTGELAEAIEGSLGQVLEFRQSLSGLHGVTRPLTNASKRAARNLDRLTTVLEQMMSWAVRAQALLESDPPADDGGA